MKKKILGLFLVSIFAWQMFENWPVKVQVKNLASEAMTCIKMPLKDKRRLDFFFRETCFLNVWAYTLFGSKPMSIDQYKKPWSALISLLGSSELRSAMLDSLWHLNFKELRYWMTPKELKMQIGWKTLNKYMCYFPNSRFFLLSNERQSHEIVDLILVDKFKLIKKVTDHLEDFQHVLNHQAITTEHLLQKKPMHQFITHLHHNGLFGTVLGFGRDNAWLFQQCHDMNLNEKPMVSAWPEQELVNLDELNRKTFAFLPWDVSDVFYPRFSCNPESEETKQLKQVYQKEREKIISYFEGKDLVEAVLSLLNSP